MRRRSTNIFLILCVLLMWAVMAPRPAPAAPDNLVPQLDAAPFGLNTHLGTRYPDLKSMDVPADLVAESGAGWAREDIQWWRIQPTHDSWDWSFSDQALRELIARKIKIVGVIGHPPGWATPYGGDPASGVSFYAPDPEHFAAFATAVAQRYGRHVHHWEIWNEPDNPLFWKPTPDPRGYAALLVRTSLAIRSIDPNAKILIGGLNPFDMHFLREIAAAGAWNSFDIIAIHPYVVPSSPENGNITAAADGIRALAAQFGPKPIWATEVGWPSGPGDHNLDNSIDEQDQANYLVRSILLLWRAGVERIFWYTLKDDPGNPYGLVAHGSGYTDYSRPKPAFYAFRTLNQQLGGAEFVGMRDLFERTTVLDFEAFGSWRRGDQPNGSLSATGAAQHGGTRAALLNYDFPTAGNDYVVFRRARPMAIPGTPYALGLWVYGDGSGNTLKLWLRDAQDEVLQYTLGTVGAPGWRLLQAPLGSPVAAWNRIGTDGDGRLDFPARVEAIVLDDAPDAFSGRGTIYLDDLIAINGREAYDLQLRRGDLALDVLWAPEPVRARISTAATDASALDRDGTPMVAPVKQAKIAVSLGPAPVYVLHTR